MGMIEDGTGSGFKAQVTEAHELVTHTHTISEIENVNISTGRVWSIPLDAVAPSGATYFFYITNLGQTKYGIYRMLLASTVAGVFRVAKVTGTAAGGTAVSPVSLNTGVVVAPDLLTIQKGASITGLTESALIAPIYIPANQPLNLELTSKIVLAPGGALAIQAPAALTVNGFISFYRIEGVV